MPPPAATELPLLPLPLNAPTSGLTKLQDPDDPYLELALCLSSHLCGQTLRHTENTFGLCVHWVALSPPRIE